MKPKMIVVAGVAAVLTSGVMYLINYLLFRNTHEMLVQLVDDLSFIPISVFIVVVVLERLLARQEKLHIRHKLNMVVGIFYSEVGNSLLRKLLHAYERHEDIIKTFSVSNKWTRHSFRSARVSSLAGIGTPSGHSIDFDDLKAFLTNKHDFLLSLLANPNLIEHEQFSDLLWAIFHLAEELESRDSVSRLSGPDLKHIEGDIGRLYGQLLYQWLSYVEHLKEKYPYLFSLTVRISPLSDNPSATVS